MGRGFQGAAVGLFVSVDRRMYRLVMIPYYKFNYY